MLSSIILKSILERKKGLMWWTIGFFLTCVMMISFYPYIQNIPEMDALMESYPPELMALFAGDAVDFSSAEGYLQGELYFMMLPIMMIIYAVGFGSGAIAKEEDDGTLDLLLSYPVSRTQIVLEKYIAMIISTGWLGLVIFLSLAGGAISISMDISIQFLFETTFNLFLLAITIGSVALALSSVTGNKGLSSGLTSAFAIGSYFVNSLGPILESLKPFRPVSVFYYYMESKPLTEGLDISDAMTYVAVSLVLLAISVVGFNRRDVG